MSAIITSVKRILDGKTFELGDQVYVDDIYQGTLEGFNQFQDGIRVVVDDGSDVLEEGEEAGAYFCIEEID